MITIDWSNNVAADFRSRIIVDPDSPILASKANRDRYTQRHPSYAGLPHLASRASEDALTWNVFRSLQRAAKLSVICDGFRIGEPQGLLLWTLAPQLDDASAKLQYIAGTLIRKSDGVFQGQMTEPDVIVLGSRGVAVVECKLSEAGKPPSHLWEGPLDSVTRRLPIYREAEPTLLGKNVANEQIAEIYQLVRMAFYALQLGESYSCTPVVVSLANKGNWHLEIPNLGKSAADLWDFFNHAVGAPALDKVNTSWQEICRLISANGPNELHEYLLNHPCLQ